MTSSDQCGTGLNLRTLSEPASGLAVAVGQRFGVLQRRAEISFSNSRAGQVYISDLPAKPKFEELLGT